MAGMQRCKSQIWVQYGVDWTFMQSLGQGQVHYRVAGHVSWLVISLGAEQPCLLVCKWHQRGFPPRNTDYAGNTNICLAPDHVLAVGALFSGSFTM